MEFVDRCFRLLEKIGVFGLSLCFGDRGKGFFNYFAVRYSPQNGQMTTGSV